MQNLYPFHFFLCVFFFFLLPSDDLLAANAGSSWAQLRSSGAAVSLGLTHHLYSLILWFDRSHLAVVTAASLNVAYSIGCCPAQEASNPGLVDISFQKVRLKENTNQQLKAALSPKIYLTHTELFSIM